MELATGLIYCAGCGSPMVPRRVELNGKEYVSYVCHKSCGVRRIYADEVNRAIVDYLQAITSEDFRKKMDKALADSVKLHSETVREARKKRLKELKDIAADPFLPDDIRKVLKFSCMQLSMTISEQVQPLRKERVTAGYFSAPAPESLEADPEGMRRAAEWYIKRVRVHETSIEFISTFDDWLRKNVPELFPAWVAPCLG